MGIYGHEVNCDLVRRELRARISKQFLAGGAYTRIAAVGQDILRDHVPETCQQGTKCPTCVDETVPCRLVLGYVNYPE